MDIYLISKYVTIGGFVFILLFLVFFDLRAREFRRLSKVQLLGLALVILAIAVYQQINRKLGEAMAGVGILLVGIESVRGKQK
jgi:putative effector of murein hydrolase